MAGDGALAVGGLVWQRWRDVWYMARVTAVAVAGDGDGDGDGDWSSSVRLHVLGESEAADKWLRADSPLLRALDELPSRDLGVGALPTRGDCVQLLVVDRALRQRWGGTHEEGEGAALVGVVRDVLVPRDASLVDVELPVEDGGGWRRRRVHVGNGYLRVISAEAFDAQRRRLQRVASTERR